MPPARTVAVAVTAVTQILSSPVSTLVLGPGSSTGAVSDSYASPITPAGYAFAIWGLIYAASLALAVYQLLPSQREREVHRRTGWWLVVAFTASTVWIPIFGTQTIWLAQVVILVLVVALAAAAVRLTRLGAADGAAQEWLLRVPITFYLGWATLASAAGFGTVLRSLGMAESSVAASVAAVVLVLVAGGAAALVVLRLSAAAGFAVSACWALVAIVVGSTELLVQLVAVVAVVGVLVLLVRRTVRSRRARVVLVG